MDFFLSIVAAISVVCIVAVLFFERKSPASSLVWVLVLLVFPVAGFVFYLFLGSGFRVSKRKQYAMKAMQDDIFDNYIVKHLNLGKSRIFASQNMEAGRTLTYLRNDADGVYTDNNHVDLFTHGKPMFDRMLADLRAARHHIHILFYIFRNDALGREILSILTKKAAEGVEVRLLYDSVGTMMASDTPFHKLKKAGGEVRAFSPIFSNLSSHLRLNYRNHRKIVVVDGLVGYVGGMNVGIEYLSMDKRLRPWRDTHLRMTGSGVWFLQERFLMDWSYSSDTDVHAIDLSTYFPEPEETGDVGMQIISSGPDTFENPIKSGMLSMLYAARKNIYIQTPYFTPDESFFDALRIAAGADVDVRLMVPALPDYRIVQLATLGYVRDAALAGAKTYLYNGFIHAKTVVVDGLVASIGTTNITNRSFTLDFEVNAFVYDQRFARKCEAVFLADQANCQQVDEEYFAAKSLLTRGSYNFARMLAPMM